jgi:hypothetical protein
MVQHTSITAAWLLLSFVSTLIVIIDPEMNPHKYQSRQYLRDMAKQELLGELELELELEGLKLDDIKVEMSTIDAVSELLSEVLIQESPELFGTYDSESFMMVLWNTVAYVTYFGDTWNVIFPWLFVWSVSSTYEEDPHPCGPVRCNSASYLWALAINLAMIALFASQMIALTYTSNTLLMSIVLLESYRHPNRVIHLYFEFTCTHKQLPFVLIGQNLVMWGDWDALQSSAVGLAVGHVYFTMLKGAT